MAFAERKEMGHDETHERQEFADLSLRLCNSHNHPEDVEGDASQSVLLGQNATVSEAMSRYAYCLVA